MNEMGNELPTVDLGSFVSVRVAAGYTHTCAVSIDGNLKCWGMLSNLLQLV